MVCIYMKREAKMNKLFKTYIFGLLFLLPVFSISAQTTFLRTLGEPKPDNANFVRQTPDGGYILVGSVMSDGWFQGFEETNLLLIKTDSTGHETWQKVYGDVQPDAGRAVCPTTDGGYIAVGTTRSPSDESDYIWLLKTDSNGDKQWESTFGKNDEDNNGSDVRQTKDGGYIIVGNTDVGEGGVADIWLIKTDKDGKKTWDKKFGGSNVEGVVCVEQTTDEGYILVGRTGTYGAGNYDIWLIKTDKTGKEEWNKTFGGARRELGFSVKQTLDGGYIVGGTTLSFSHGMSDIWLIKTDKNGNETWSRSFGSENNENFNSVQQTTDHGYIIAGTIQDDLWLIKTDQNGTQEWDRQQDYASYNILPGEVQQTADGGYIIAGSIRAMVDDVQYMDPILLKTDAYGGVYLERVTAQEKLGQVTAMAFNTDHQAQLVRVYGENINELGQSEQWVYIYQSTNPIRTTEVRVLYGEVHPMHWITAPNINSEESMNAIPSAWIDSDVATNYAKMNGCDFFSNQQDNVPVNLSLYASNPGEATWELEYHDGAQNEIFQVNGFLNYQPLYTWSSQTSGTSLSFRDVYTVSNQMGWILAGEGNILRTFDAGKTWEESTVDTILFAPNTIFGLDDSVAIMIGRDDGTDLHYIYRTENGGASWSYVYKKYHTWLNNVHMFSPSHGIILGDPADGEWVILETEDGGLTWNPITNAPDPLEGEWGTDGCWTDSLNGWFGTSESRIFHTTDGGKQWTAVTVPYIDRVRKVGSDGHGTVLATSGSSGGLIRSRDDGQNWEMIQLPETDFIRQILYNQQYFWVLTSSALYRSSDGGTWIVEQLSEEGLFRDVSFAVSGGLNAGWIIGDNNTIVRMTPVTAGVKQPESSAIPKQAELHQNYPNPFNAQTTIQFSIRQSGHVKLSIYNILGATVATLVQDRMEPGTYQYKWDAQNQSSGLYFYSLETENYVCTRKLLLLK